ncbi:HET-domain-containing protein, partial [Glonium stellatum]
DDPAASFIGRTPINRSVGSPETFSRARDWISECDNQHKNCPKLESVILPTRLIDVSVPGKPFLYVSGLEETGAYASLSYCWGGPQPFKTTLENIEEYQKILPESELPQTIRDAITASHQLGFQFLWIDSLCIIQNSSTDVEKEIARMQEIYKNSAVTIAAANADKCSDGFLYERPSSSLEFCIPFPCGEDGQGAVFLRDWDVGKWREPLSERAWTFQEMTLSPRVLIYGAKQLYWRCPTAFYADGGDMTWDNYCDRTSTSTLQSTWTFFKENLRPKEPSYSLTDGKRRRSWINIVNDYTRRKLSVQDDKLLALSGIATEFHNSFGWSYLAGLWKESLTDDLMWRRAKPDPDLHPLSYRAPSWSWVSCYGAISYDDPNEAFYDGHVKRSYVMARRVVAEIISCQTSLFSTDVPFGRVIDGKLTLRAPLKHAEMECLTDYIGSLVGSGSTASTNMGNAERPSVGHVWLDGPKGVNKEQQSPISQDKKRSSSPVFCLIVQFKGKSDTEMFAQGLVLKQVSAEDDSQGQLYRRVGLFECSDSVEEAFFENCPEHTVVII